MRRETASMGAPGEALQAHVAGVYQPRKADERTKEELIAAVREDPRAFAALYQQYVAAVYQYLYLQVGNHHDAEDLTATSFSKAFASLRRYEGHGTFAAWLFSIARHTLGDYWRRYRPAVDVTAVMPPPVDPALPLEAAVVNAERIQSLYRALGQLPPEQREALALYYFSELSTAEIAVVQHCTAGAVRMRIHRALTVLRGHYHQEGE